MMMECPRCGFVQPQDRYCANCGLNIETYLAKPKPLTERIFKNPAFHISLIVLVIFAVVIYIQKNRVTTVSSSPAMPVPAGTAPVTAPQPNPGTATSSTAPSPTPTAPVQPPTETVRAEAEAKAIAAITNSAGEVSVAARAGTSPAGGMIATTGEAADLPGKLPTQIEIQFYEVPRDLFAKISAEGKSVLDQTGLRVIAIPSLDKLTSHLVSARKLPMAAAHTMGVQASSSMSLQFTTGTGPAAQGLVLEFNIIKPEKDSWAIEIAGLLELKHEARPLPGTGAPPAPGAAGETHNKFEGTAPLAHQGALVITNLLPHKPVSEAVASALNSTPLDILDTAEFMMSETELIGVLQPK